MRGVEPPTNLLIRDGTLITQSVSILNRRADQLSIILMSVH